METKNINTCHSSTSLGMTRRFSGFTLVELIVVITILVILGTIGFVSIGGYSSNARDSTRSSDLANIAKSLDVSLIRIGYYPDPDNVFSVTYSGGILWKQGTVGDSVITTLNAGGGVKLSKKPTDPLVSTREYSYSKTVYGNAYQLKGDWEGESVAYQRGENNNQRIVFGEDIFGEFLTSSFSPLTPAYASPGNPTLSYIKGNYNGMVAKTETGSTKYLLAIPSLFLGTSASSGSTVNFSPVSSTGFLLHGQSNSSTGFVFTGVVVYSSGALPSTDAERILFASGIANAYSGTILASSSSIKPFITALNTNSTGSLASLGGSVVNGSLGGSIGSSSSSGGGNSLVSGACTGLPSNAVYYGGVTSYSLVNAPTGTSLAANYTGGIIPTNTCQFNCSGGYAWNESQCSNAIGPYRVSGANHDYYMIPCPSCNLNNISLATLDAKCQSLGFLRTIRTSNTSGGIEYNGTQYESISHNQLGSVANDFDSRAAIWNVSGIYNYWKSWHQGLSTWGDTWNATADYGCNILNSSCTGLGYGTGINGSNTFIPCASNP